MSHPLGLRPSKIIAVHLNYRSRAAERGRTPSTPSYFLKPPSSLSASGAPVVRPRECRLLAFEGEIAAILGRRARGVSVDDALEHVAHFTAANDLGSYDLRHADRGSNLRAKGADGFTPVGPTLLDAARVGPALPRLRTWVNGELVQDTEGDHMLFELSYLIADLSRLVTLEPGDIVLTGTPSGSRPVEPGDVVEVELDGAGRLRNEIVAAEEDLLPIGAMPRVTDEELAAAYGATATAPAATAAAPGGLADRTARALGQVCTATLSVQLRRRGIENAFIEGVAPARADLRLLGVARTLRYVALREDIFAERGGGMNAQKRTVDSLRPGEVLVIEARGDRSAGTVGDILALRAARLGAAGIVTDGAVRDGRGIGALPLPVYHAGTHAAVLGRRHVPLDSGLPVTCGGVLVMPGDVLVGDADGVVVVPRALADEVAAAALLQEREERFIAEQVAAGASLDGLYPLGPQRRAEYAQWCNVDGQWRDSRDTDRSEATP
jgi:5-oxopent-3-ene-1,2,5-tricarboxylate decarboxylase / 2-hydroxyhepta-2,4-diene-1,7-dioate isomerase